jgi:flagellar hook assembly protein FlgD
MVYDIAGQRLRTLLNRNLPAGHHQATWDGTDGSGKLMGSGVYLFRLRGESFDQVGRMLLLK